MIAMLRFLLRQKLSLEVDLVQKKASKIHVDLAVQKMIVGMTIMLQLCVIHQKILSVEHLLPLEVECVQKKANKTHADHVVQNLIVGIPIVLHLCVGQKKILSVPHQHLLHQHLLHQHLLPLEQLVQKLVQKMHANLVKLNQIVETLLTKSIVGEPKIKTVIIYFYRGDNDNNFKVYEFSYFMCFYKK